MYSYSSPYQSMSNYPTGSPWPPAFSPPAAQPAAPHPQHGFGLPNNVNPHNGWGHSGQTVHEGPAEPQVASVPERGTLSSQKGRKRKRDDFDAHGRTSEVPDNSPKPAQSAAASPAQQQQRLHDDSTPSATVVERTTTAANFEAQQRRLAKVEAQPTWGLLDRLFKLNVIGKALSESVLNNEATASRYAFLGSSVARYHVSRLLDIKSTFALPHLLTQVRGIVNSTSNVAQLWETIGLDVIAGRINPDLDPRNIRKKSRVEQVHVLLAELDEFATSGPNAARISVTRNQDALRADAANLRDDIISLLLFLGEEQYYNRQVKLGHPKNQHRAIK